MDIGTKYSIAYAFFFKNEGFITAVLISKGNFPLLTDRLHLSYISQDCKKWHLDQTNY